MTHDFKVEITLSGTRKPAWSEDDQEKITSEITLRGTRSMPQRRTAVFDQE